MIGPAAFTRLVGTYKKTQEDTHARRGLDRGAIHAFNSGLTIKGLTVYCIHREKLFPQREQVLQ